MLTFSSVYDHGLQPSGLIHIPVMNPKMQAGTTTPSSITFFFLNRSYLELLQKRNIDYNFLRNLILN